MKTKTFKSFLIAILAAMLPQLASAYDFKVDGIAYNYNEDGTSVTVTNGCSYSDPLIIPSFVSYEGNTYTVAKIDSYVFAFWGMTSVSIPNTVKRIGTWAFQDCNNLTSLTITGQGELNDYGSGDLRRIQDQIKTLNIGCGITSMYYGHISLTPNVINCYAETPPNSIIEYEEYYDDEYYYWTEIYTILSNFDGELHVPPTSTAAYFTDDYWQNFTNLNPDLTDKVTLDKSNASLVQWETLALTANVNPENGELRWNTSNIKVATVDENGLVTATGEGECDVYATLASNPAVYAWCHFTVSYPEITLSLSDENLEMNVGDEHALIATIIPENTGITPSWYSSDESIATVENGIVHANSEGECYISVTVLDKTASCHVIVSGDDNITILLNIDSAILGSNQILTVYPTCTPDVPVELVVTSSDPSVAVARVVNRTNAPAAGLKSFPEQGMAFALMEELAAPSESKAPALASTKAIMIVGVQNGTATITVTTADGMAVPAVLELRVVDVDGDRVITSGDITALYNYLLSGDNTFAATSDVDGDGYVTSGDITIIYNLILGN